MATSYGIPYVGSKNRFAEVLISKIPSAENFYDLFCGGCAMSHVALLSGKYKNVYANDMRDTADFFLQCLKGEIKEEGKYYNRNEFHLFKNSSIYCGSVFSFGNNFDDYLYGMDKQDLMECANRMIMSDTMEERYSFFKIFVDMLKKPKNLSDFIDSNSRLEVVARLLRLRSISLRDISPNIIERFHPIRGDYRDVELKQDSVIYCDIPYIDSTKDTYQCNFNYEEFYNYVRSLVADGYKVFISEYTAPSDFVPIVEIGTVSTFSQFTNATPRVERLFVHESQRGGEPPHQLMLPFDE